MWTGDDLSLCWKTAGHNVSLMVIVVVALLPNGISCVGQGSIDATSPIGPSNVPARCGGSSIGAHWRRNGKPTMLVAHVGRTTSFLLLFRKPICSCICSLRRLCFLSSSTPSLCHPCERRAFLTTSQCLKDPFKMHEPSTISRDVFKPAA